GACTVHIEGKPLRSCLLPVGAIGNRAITTIEGIGATRTGAAVQKAWLDLEVIQCGYCQSGQIMSAAALLANTPHPDDSDIDAAMAGNICRCATHGRIREAIKPAAGASQTWEAANVFTYAVGSCSFAARAAAKRTGRSVRAWFPCSGGRRERAGAASR